MGILSAMGKTPVKASIRKDGVKVRAHERRAVRGTAAADTAAAAEAASGVSDGQQSGSAQQAASRAASSYLHRKRRSGTEPSARTLAAVRGYVVADMRRKDHLGSSVAGERNDSSRPMFRDPDSRLRWFEVADRSVPEGMILNAAWRRDGKLALTVEGPGVSRSECCDAEVVVRDVDPGDDTIPHRRVNCDFGCDECGDIVESHEFARFAGGIISARRTSLYRMPEIDDMVSYAEKSRDLLRDMLAGDALVAANERLDEFVAHGGSDDVVVGEIDPEGLRDGATGIRLVDDPASAAPPDRALVQGWTVIDTQDGKQLHCTPATDVSRTAEFERCLASAADLAGRLP